MNFFHFSLYVPTRVNVIQDVDFYKTTEATCATNVTKLNKKYVNQNINYVFNFNVKFWAALLSLLKKVVFTRNLIRSLYMS
jgi:hypothetical protein